MVTDWTDWFTIDVKPKLHHSSWFEHEGRVYCISCIDQKDSIVLQSILRLITLSFTEKPRSFTEEEIK